MKNSRKNSKVNNKFKGDRDLENIYFENEIYNQRRNRIRSFDETSKFKIF